LQNMKAKLLLISALLASAIAPTFGQAASPMATPNRTETFAIVPDGTHTAFQLKWDVYLPPTQGQYPAVLVIFGGEFKDGDRSDVGGIASYIASQGFVALAIDYRVDQQDIRTGQQYPVYAPPANPNQPGDVKLAVTAARTGVIPGPSPSIIQPYITGKVGAVGGSSGASHALWCAATGSLSTDKLNAAVLFSGAYEFDDPNSLTWCGLTPRCSYGSGPKFRADVYRYCGLNPNNQTCMTPLPTPIPQALHDGSPIYQIQENVSPLFWISDPGDLITPYQFSDLSNLIASLNLDPNVYIGVLLGEPYTCNHGFDNWQNMKSQVIPWLHLRLDN
jgi:dienelactone hydrolase